MSRLDTLLAAMPRIADAITGLDSDLRHVAFDMLTRAALDDADQAAHPAQLADGAGLGGDHQTGVNYPAIFDTADSRTVGTFTPDGTGTGGTFTPASGYRPSPEMLDLYHGNAVLHDAVRFPGDQATLVDSGAGPSPSDVPTYDDVARSQPA